MSAASDAREQLEAVIRQQLTAIQHPGRGRVTHNAAVSAILGYADAYGRACAEQRARELLTPDELPGRKRLAEATAERTGSTR